MKCIIFILGRRIERETREDDTSNKSDDRKREKGRERWKEERCEKERKGRKREKGRERGGERRKGEGREGKGRTEGRKKKGLSVVRDVLVLRHMESRLSASWLLQCVEALEFEISRIGARSIHLRDNIFRSKYEYYIISAVDAEFLSPLSSSPFSRRAANLPLPPLPRKSL